MDIYFYLSNFLIKIFVFYITYEPFRLFEEAYLKKSSIGFFIQSYLSSLSIQKYFITSLTDLFNFFDFFHSGQIYKYLVYLISRKNVPAKG